MAEKDENKPYTTRPTSQLDLEARLDDGHTPESQITKTITVNPNPFGEEAYVGTDPIYQNHANDTEKPIAAKSGADKLAEGAVKEAYDLSDVPKDELVADYGQGGKARVSKVGSPDVSDVMIGGGDVRHTRDEKPADADEKPDTTVAEGDPTPAESPKQTPAPPVPPSNSSKANAEPDGDKNKS